MEDVFESIEKKAVAKKCDAMEGLIKEAEGIMTETHKGTIRDAGIIESGQKVEHYEIATYGTLATSAGILVLDECGIPSKLAIFQNGNWVYKSFPKKMNINFHLIFWMLRN